MDSNQEVNVSPSSIKRGEMYYIKCDKTQSVDAGSCYGGSNDGKVRSAIIVSNNDCNRSSSFVELVYTTTKDKAKIPTHVKIKGSNGVICTAMCEQVHSVDKSRVSRFIKKCSSYEVDQVSEALKVSLELKNKEAVNFGFSASDKLLSDVSKFMTLLSEKCQKINELDSKIDSITKSSKSSVLSDILDEEDMSELLKVATRKLSKERESTVIALKELLSASRAEDVQQEVKDVKPLAVKKALKSVGKRKRFKKSKSGVSTRVEKIAQLYKQGLSAAEIAETMGISKQAVYSTKNYAIRKNLLDSPEGKSERVEKAGVSPIN